MLRTLSSLSITWGHVQIILYLIQKVWVSFHWTGKIKRIGKMQHTRRDNPKKKIDNKIKTFPRIYTIVIIIKLSRILY